MIVRKIFVTCLILFISVISALYAQVNPDVNIDTPNLSFEKGNFSGWERYTGDFYYTSATGTYQYGAWAPITTNDARFIIGSNNNDPIVACDLKNSPLDKNAVRIGEPLKCENGSTAYRGAAAEQLIYRFKVTANTTLLSYKLAAVLRTPADDNHGGEQQPLYSMVITVKDAAGNEAYLTCSDYSTIADFANPKLLRNKTKTQCPSSIASKPEQYTYQPWYSGNLDLSAHLGDSVIITIRNRDCLYDYGGLAGIKGGSHESYGYFWAETRKLELTSSSCENVDAEITAPGGFKLYEWSRNDNYPVTIPDPVNYPNVAKIEKTLNWNGVVYYCKMTDPNAGCGATITLSTKINQVVITPAFTWSAINAGEIKFNNTSSIVNDNITKYHWEFGDGDTSNQPNPTHTYKEFKQFTVYLTVISSKGCEKTISQNVLPTKELIADIFPPANLGYNGQTKDFTATTNITGLQINIDYFIRYTNKPGTPFYNSYTAPSNVGDYNATFELSFQSALKYFMNSVPSKDFTITKAPLTLTINNVSKIYGQAISLQREGFVSSMNPLYAGDKIYELNVKSAGLPDTASVKVYEIKADTAFGFGVSNYDITFVKGELTVNPKALTIKAVDKSKIYGDVIVPTGREFFITPGSMIAKDSVRTVNVSCPGFVATAGVGTQTITISGASGYRLNNYTISYTDALLEIAKKKLTVIANALTKVYGTPYVFSKKDFTVDKTLFVGTDSISNLTISSGATVFNAPVNDYPIVITNPTGPGIDNYDVKLINSLFTVTPKPVTITPVDQTKEYGDVFTFTGQEFTTNVPMVQGDTILAVTLKSTGVVQTASIGSYDILASQAYGNGTLNYNFTYANGELKVIKKLLVATITPPANLNYNATAKSFTATVNVSSLVMNSDYFIRYTNRAGTAAYNSTIAPAAAGDYTATFEATPATLQNYRIDNIPTQDFTIQKVPVIITIDNASKTYGDIYTLAGTSFKSNLQPLYGTDNISSVNLTSKAVSDTASVGVYPIVATSINGNGLNNYIITYVDGQFTVSAKPLLIKATNQSKTYGDVFVATGNEFFVDTKHLVGNDAVNSVSLASAGFAATAAVGSYPVQASNAAGVRLGNYQITYTEGILQVNKKPLSVTALDQTITYGDTFTFTGNEFSKSVKLVGNDTIYSATISSGATVAKASAGSYSIGISGLTGVGLNNYDITLYSGTFTVLRKAVTVTANNIQKEYGTALTFNGNEFTTDIPLVAGDNLSYASLSSQGIPALSPVGEYDIDISQAYGPGSMNYNFTYVKGKLTVVKKRLTATLNAPSYLGYNAQAKDFTATLNIAGLEQNRDYELRYVSVPDPALWNSDAAPKAAGDYKVIFVLIGQSPDRYFMDDVPTSNFTISKAPLNITADNATKTYGDKLNILQDAFKSDLKPLYGSDNIYGVQFDCSGLNDTSSVGRYPIVPKMAVGNGITNYDIRYLPGELTVLPKHISVKAVNLTKTYGDEYTSDGSEFYVDPSVLVGKDVIVKVRLSSAGFAKAAVTGNYPVAINGVEGGRTGNYTFTFIDGTLNVVKRKVVVTVQNITKTYGDAYMFKPTDYKYDRTLFVGNDSIRTVVLSSQAEGFKAPVGTYPIIVSSINGAGLLNYDIETIPGQFTVSPLSLTITAKDASKQYGTLYTFNGNEFTTDKLLVKGDTILYVLIKSEGTSETASVRDYDITASMAYGVGIQNYSITYIPGRLSVVRRALSASLVPPAYLVYNAQPKVVTAVLSATGLTLNTDYFIRYTNNNGYDGFVAPVNAGTYTAKFELSSLASLFYQINYLPQENFTITKAPLTVTANNATKIYGEKLNLRSDAFSTDMKPLFGSDKIFTVDFKCDGSADTAMVKTYTITPENPSGNGLDNYNIAYKAGELTVVRKSITLKAPDVVKTYGDTLIVAPTNFYIDPYALVGNDKVTAATFESDGTRKSSTIGSYPLKIMKATGRRLENYNLNFADGNIQVVKRQLTVTARRITKEYGIEYIFKGDEFEVDKNELAGNDFVHSVKLNSIATNKKASVGEYVLSVTDVSGFNLENYSIKMQAGVMSVTPLPLVVTPGNIEKEFGDSYSFSGTEFSLNRPMLNNDTISYVFMKSNGTTYNAPIGEYNITASQAVGVGSLNYTITFGVGKLKVIQKTLHVTAGNFVKEYGEKDPELRFSVLDKNGTEYQPSLFSGNVARQTGETPGVYPVRKGTLSIPSSYTFTFAEGKLEIKKALPAIDPEFRNENGNQIIADVIGSTNGSTPKGKCTISCPETGFTGDANLVNGQGITSVTGLPNHQTELVINYSGDENYLPASKKMTIYALNYHVNGGSMLSTVAHYDGSLSLKFETPVRDENYRFEGWFETPDFANSEVRRIPAGTYRDVDVYAKWSASYIDLYIVVLFNQILAVANPQNREILYTATYKWFKDGVQLDGSKQYIGFEKYVPSGNYKVEIYPENGTVITLELAHQETQTKSMAYPNPMKVTSSLKVESPLVKDENTVLDVVTAVGQKAGNIVVERAGDKFVLRGFSKPGVYFVRLSVNGEIKETHKIIVEN